VRLTASLGAACAILAMLAGCSPPASAPATVAPTAPAVVVAHDDYGLTATARSPSGCAASLSRPAGSGRALSYRNECEAALGANVRTLAALLAALFGAADLPAEITHLDAGRLVMTWPEVALRLALAARGSPEWDAERAWRNDGFANAQVRELANRERIFREVEAVFERHGRRVSLTSVQKVLIGPPELTPIAAQLRAQGVGERERLPFDAQLWFELRPAAAAQDPGFRLAPE
jgi:hypothetical protein